MAQQRFHGGESGAGAGRRVDKVPTVLRVGAYRFFFYSNENAEPKHIHVRTADGEAKYWLDPIKLAWNRGFNERQIREIERAVSDHQDELNEAWSTFFGETDHDEEE